MDQKAILTAFLDRIWSQGDATAVPEFIAAQYTIHHDPGDPWDGQTLDPAGFADRLVRSRAAAPDQVFTPVRMLEDGASVAVFWTWAGTHLGDLPGAPATGRRITMSGATLYDFEDGLLTGHWQIADRLSVWQQIGT
ncbi:MAG: ester cyclase [Paracoccaceae bacterium]